MWSVIALTLTRQRLMVRCKRLGWMSVRIYQVLADSGGWTSPSGVPLLSMQMLPLSQASQLHRGCAQSCRGMASRFLRLLLNHWAGSPLHLWTCYGCWPKRHPIGATWRHLQVYTGAGGCSWRGHCCGLRRKWLWSQWGRRCTGDGEFGATSLCVVV